VRGIRIGELLVDQGTLTRGQVHQILFAQQRTNRPFGDLAERLFGINPRAIEDAWVNQYLQINGQSDLGEMEIDPRAIKLLSERQAWQFHLLPLYREGDEIHVATSAQDLVRAMNFSTRAISGPVYFIIAERRQLREYLMRHYPVPQHIAEYSAQLA
jgi:hypothetical protein